MSTNAPVHIKTISEYHRLLGLPGPEHPLVSLIRFEDMPYDPERMPQAVMHNFYSIALKKSFHARLKYGQQEVDFSEGVMLFMAPMQVLSIEGPRETVSGHKGWLLLVHPDLLWNSPIAKKIRHYEYFDYKASDGVCLLEDGARVYAMGISGMAAEKAVINKSRIVKVPAELDDVTAAALPNAIIGSAMALRFKADLQPGDVVLINGATSFTGRIAVQIARHYGAKKIIITGRNLDSLGELLMLGADETISILQDDKTFKAQLAAIHAQSPIDVIIDYLWGHTAEMILDCIKGDGSFTNRIRYASVGSIAGDRIQLSAANLRSVNLQLSGSGLGAWSKSQVGLLFSEILPEMFALAAKGKLQVKTVAVRLQDVADLWDLEVAGGQRLVVTI